MNKIWETFINRNNPEWIKAEITRREDVMDTILTFCELASVEGATYYLENLFDLRDKNQRKIDKLKKKLLKII